MTFKLRSGNTTPFKKMASKDSKAYGIAKKNHELPEVKITGKRENMLPEVEVKDKKPTRYKKSKKITQQVVDDPDSTIDKSKTKRYKKAEAKEVAIDLTPPLTGKMKKWKREYDKSVRRKAYTGKHKLVPRVTGKIEFK